MSGEFFSNFGQGVEIKKGVIDNVLNVFDIDGTNYQLSCLTRGIVENWKKADLSKILSLKGIERVKKLESEIASELQSNRGYDKYSINVLRLGIVGYSKREIKFAKPWELKTLPKRKKGWEKRYFVKGSAFLTMKEAKEFAKKIAIKGSEMERVVIKEGSIENNRYRSVKVGDTRVVGWYEFPEVRKYKTEPKTGHAESYIIIPEYLYYASGCLTDYEYEYM